jgi:hypothetical protein
MSYQRDAHLVIAEIWSECRLSTSRPAVAIGKNTLTTLHD